MSEGVQRGEPDARSASGSGKYRLRAFLLRFDDPVIEEAYRDFTLERTLLFCRIAWAMVLLLGGSFAFLDHSIFGDDRDIVLTLRGVILAFAALLLAATFVSRLKWLLEWSSALFILSVGTFTIILTAMGDPATISPYFTGLFYAFAGIFCTAGFGFTRSFFAFLVNLLVLEVAVGIVAPVTSRIFIIYNFFVPGIILVFAYAGYLIERVARENFAVSEQLRNSLAQVKNLSGLLPICAACKMIRDDKGYWNQIESYISSHSEAQFSHGLCPGCAAKLFPDQAPERQDGESSS